MSKHILELTVALALTIAAVLSIASGAAAGDVIVKGAFARASATKAATSASLYMTIVGNGAADRLIGVSSPVAGMAMLHESRTVDGIAQMSHLDSVDIPADGEIVLSPGGIHVMLTGLKQPLRRGDKVTLNLTFEKAGTVELSVPVGSVAQDGPPVD